MPAINKTISCLLRDDGSEAKNDKEILMEMKRFYSELHSYKIKDNNANCKLKTKFFPKEDVKLTQEMKEYSDRVITKQELLRSLKAMKHGKSPVLGGFTVEFYKFFW